MSDTSFNPELTFADLGVRPRLVAALAERGIVHPFPIQEMSVPDALAGRDVLGRGRTGSGKTAAYALPVVSRLDEEGRRREPRRPRALVLVPTRELAVQVHDTVSFLAEAVRLRSMTVFGGVKYTGQVRRLERGVDIVIATPGRLEDLIAQGHLDLSAVRITVLDEADMMADMGFLPVVTRILEQVPADGQRLLYSATLDGDVQTVVDRFLHDPLVHSVTEEEGAPDIDHYVFLVDRDNKDEVVRELLAGGGRTLAFARTKFGAERLARELTAAGIPAVDLHGNLTQAKRQRNLSSFADGSVSVLVATDIAARGIHVDNIGLVVHIDPPIDPKAYTHRSGRTARAGSSGTVVTMAVRNQNRLVRGLMAKVKINPTRLVVKPGDEIVEQVRAARVEAVPTGPSIFAPDPEDAVEEASGFEGRRDRRERDDRPRGRGDRAWGRGEGSWGRGERPRGRGDRPGRPKSDRRPEGRRDGRRPGDRVARGNERPERAYDRAEHGDDGWERPWEERPRERGPRANRPWEDRARDDRGGDDRGRDDRPAGRFGDDRRGRGEREERRRPGHDRPPRRVDGRREHERGELAERARRGAPERRPANRRGQRDADGRPGARYDRRDRGDRFERNDRFAGDRFDRGDRSERNDRFDRGDHGEHGRTEGAPEGGVRVKQRWTSEDRRKREESREHGFGYTKRGAPKKGTKAGGKKKLGPGGKKKSAKKGGKAKKAKKRS